jgi:hypothetical protein
LKLEAISKQDFGSRSPAKTQRDKKGGSEVQPEGILKYSEELKRAPNTETCPPPADWAIRRRPAGYALTRKTFLR